MSHLVTRSVSALALLLATGCFESRGLGDESAADMRAPEPEESPYPEARVSPACGIGAALDLVTALEPSFACGDFDEEHIRIQLSEGLLGRTLPARFTIGEGGTTAILCSGFSSSCARGPAAVSGEVTVVRLPERDPDGLVRYELEWGTGWRVAGESTIGARCSCR